MEKQKDTRKEKGIKEETPLYDKLLERVTSRESTPESLKLFTDIEKLRNLLLPIKEKYKLTSAELMQLLEEKLFFPDSILNDRLTVLESVTKYLKENRGLSLRRTAKVLARDERNIWHIYSNAKRKYSERFVIRDVRLWIPVSIFSKARLSALEAIVNYLKELGFSYGDIAVLLNRDDRTVWTVYKRAKVKMKI